MVSTEPNKGLEPTARSVRSCVATASGSSSCLAFGFRRKEGPAVASRRETQPEQESGEDVLTLHFSNKEV